MRCNEREKERRQSRDGYYTTAVFLLWFCGKYIYRYEERKCRGVVSVREVRAAVEMIGNYGGLRAAAGIRTFFCHAGNVRVRWEKFVVSSIETFLSIRCVNSIFLFILFFSKGD